ncbi:hypothetical protein OUZ56_018500 [Daphnia magna]|uniref:Uncharacterized protein n=1 Tax=Daphnia magna TaxID=35525 RepID=A0ABQ9ZA59_9CRUS|nr:hypothetical protein OUZ56_018498 [Daphnia magna]KAK4009385.1 hypothetical protein OUZ56_018500 [Daphnia magna]
MSSIKGDLRYYALRQENFSEGHHNNSSPHLDSNTDLQHHIQKGYNYAIDNDVNIHRQLEHKLNCFGKQHYQAQALNFQLSFKKTHHPGGCKNVLTCNLP